MSPFTAKRQRANACRPSGPCPAPSITCAWRGPRPVRTAAVSRKPHSVPRQPFHRPEVAGAGRDRHVGTKEGKPERESWRAEEGRETLNVLGSGVLAAADFGCQRKDSAPGCLCDSFGGRVLSPKGSGVPLSRTQE